MYTDMVYGLGDDMDQFYQFHTMEAKMNMNWR